MKTSHHKKAVSHIKKAREHEIKAKEHMKMVKHERKEKVLINKLVMMHRKY